MEFRDLLNKLVSFESLSKQEIFDLFNQLMDGVLSNTQIASLLVALRMKGETSEEITGAALAMREKAIRIPVEVTADEPLVDIVGTGGDATLTFNISTASAFVVAAGGVKVAKHGNRSVSSKSGSADVLEALGVNINVSPEVVSLAVNKIGIGFLFAQRLHPAMKHAAPVRKELGIRSIFNLLGPLSNPAYPNTFLLGVYDRDKVKVFAQALKDMGVKKAFVVHGAGGMDELSNIGENYVCYFDGYEINEMTINPVEFGLPIYTLEEIRGGEPSENAKIILEIFSGKRDGKMDIVALNSGAALYLAGKCNTLREGIELAYNIILSGKAMDKLNELIRFSKEYV